jgi:hypothetical protein
VAGLALARLFALPAAAQDRVGVRVGDHPGFGRVVFDWPGSVEYRVEEAEGRILVHFASPAAFDLAPARRGARNLRGVTSDGSRAEIAVAPGTRLRHFRLGNRVVLDLLDAARDPAATPAAARPAPPPAALPPPARAPAAAIARGARAPAAPSPSSPFAPAVPPPAEAPVIVQAAPLEAVAVQALAQPTASPPTPTPPPAPPAAAGRAIRLLPGPVLSIPAAAETGAALFRRGGLWMLVLDQPQPLDLSALRGDPAFANAESSSGPQSTTLRLPAAALPNPRLRREGSAWLLDQPREEVALRAILPEVEPGPPARLILRATHGSGSVSVLDPETGTALLVGTVRDGAEAVPAGRRAALFELLPTRLGAALLPRADTVTLRALDGRFVADAAPGAEMALGPEAAGAVAAAASMTRIFDLPAEPLAALQERLRGATAAVAASPPLGRGPPRLQAAEALLALGLPQEAQAMVGLATREDPALAETPRARALAGATALLAGRLAEAGGLDHPRLPDTDEVALWRGLLSAARGQNGAASVAAGLPLLLAYPEPLQSRIAQLAAEALAAGGEPAAARRLIAARDQEDPPLALARARILEAEGATEPALAAYDALAAGRDRRARAIAMRRAAELRLSAGLLDAAGAAAALESTLAAWRGDALETEGRSRLADLRQQAGDWRGAFDLLRETAAMFPDLAPGIRPRQVAALLGALDTAPPLDAVVLHDTHAEMLPPGPATEQALGSLADRLAALDLLDRASHVLRGAMARAPDAEARGRIGARLAGLALAAGDQRAALVALADTAGEGLSPGLTRRRLLLEGRGLARDGRVPDAVARYREAGPEAAAELATLLEEKQDWPGAAAALRLHLDAVAPAPPAPLAEEHQPLVARLAAPLTLAGDDSALAALRAEQEGRMGGTLSDAFGLFTADRVAAVSDLPRLGRELDVARGLPSQLDGLRAGSPATR